MKIVDLSIPLNDKTPVYPGDSKLEIEQIAEVDKNGWSEKRLHLNTHCSTHLDAPAHMLKNGKNLDQLPLDKFYGKGIIIDVRKKEIGLDCLKGVSANDVVLFLTGQSKKKNYFEGAKFMSEDVAKKLVELKTKAIGLDSFSPDKEPYPIHKILMPHDIIIIENLTNLEVLLNKMQ